MCIAACYVRLPVQLSFPQKIEIIIAIYHKIHGCMHFDSNWVLHTLYAFAWQRKFFSWLRMEDAIIHAFFLTYLP